MLNITLKNFRVMNVEGPIYEWKIDLAQQQENSFHASAISRDNKYSADVIFNENGYVLIIKDLETKETIKTIQKEFNSDGCGVLKLGGGPVKSRGIGFINAVTMEFLSEYGIDNIRTFNNCGNIYYFRGNHRLHDSIYIPSGSNFEIVDGSIGEHHQCTDDVEISSKDFIDENVGYVKLDDLPDFVILDDYRKKAGKIISSKRHIVIKSGDKVFGYKEKLDEMKKLIMKGE